MVVHHCLIEVHSVSQQSKQKAQMRILMDFPSILLEHCELRSNSSKLTPPMIPFGIVTYTFVGQTLLETALLVSLRSSG